MRKLTFILTLLATLGLSQQATAEDSGDEDEGPVFIADFTYLDLPDDDVMYVGRMAVGWTLEVGIQLGANLAFYSLDRPSVDGVVFTKPPATPNQQELETYTLDPEFTYWGFGPMVGFDLELVEDWFGLEFMVTPTFPITNDSSGWSIEVGAYPYLSLEWIADWLDLALMAGIKYVHEDVEADRSRIKEDLVTPAVGAAFQF